LRKGGDLTETARQTDTMTREQKIEEDTFAIHPRHSFHTRKGASGNEHGDRSSEPKWAARKRIRVAARRKNREPRNSPRAPVHESTPARRRQLPTCLESSLDTD